VAHLKHAVDLSHHVIVHLDAPAPRHRHEQNLIAQHREARDARFVTKKNSTVAGGARFDHVFKSIKRVGSITYSILYLEGRKNRRFHAKYTQILRLSLIKLLGSGAHLQVRQSE
jgi:hypothetical protein